MLVLTFTDSETAQISAESQTFADKLRKLATLRKNTGQLCAPSSPAADPQVFDYLQGIAKHGMQTQVQMVRKWAKEHGITRYSSLAGAKRIVEAYQQKQKETEE